MCIRDRSGIAQMRERYSDKYPDLRNAQTQLKVLQAERDKLLVDQEAAIAKANEESANAAAAASVAAKKGTNFQVAANMNQLQGQIDQSKVALQTTEMERTDRMKQQ